MRKRRMLSVWKSSSRSRYDSLLFHPPVHGNSLVTGQRHKLGTNLTPVTPETFAKWKQTRMDKKLAEDEALKKAKDEKHAAGKNSGMSGRDLVRHLFSPSHSVSLLSSFPCLVPPHFRHCASID